MAEISLQLIDGHTSTYTFDFGVFFFFAGGKNVPFKFDAGIWDILSLWIYFDITTNPEGVFSRRWPSGANRFSS